MDRRETQPRHLINPLMDENHLRLFRIPSSVPPIGPSLIKMIKIIESPEYHASVQGLCFSRQFTHGLLNSKMKGAGKTPLSHSLRLSLVEGLFNSRNLGSLSPNPRGVFRCWNSHHRITPGLCANHVGLFSLIIPSDLALI